MRRASAFLPKLNRTNCSPLVGRALRLRDRFEHAVKTWVDDDAVFPRKAENAAVYVLVVCLLFCIAVWTTVGFNALRADQIAHTTSAYGTR